MKKRFFGSLFFIRCAALGLDEGEATLKPLVSVPPRPKSPNLCQSFRSVMNLGLMDGSVRKITASINQRVWSQAINPSDGGPMGQW